MLKSATLTLVGLYGTLCVASTKRGLVYIPNDQWPEDDAVWIQPGSDLTWYYTYNDSPNPEYSGLEFVPMMWGMGSDPEETSFLDSVVRQIESGVQIKNALAFNEPDMKSEWGGSDLEPARAAQGYVANFVPLQEYGVRLGMPAVSGAGWGIQWLRDFVGNCSQIMESSGQGSECPYDFVPVHWYDNFGGLQSHIEEAMTEFPDAGIWVTEYALANQDLAPTQEYYNQSAEYFDSNDKIERYSYFGAFRSKVSNVGPNATFLNNAGLLTDIGSWYLGFGATGVDPNSG